MQIADRAGMTACLDRRFRSHGLQVVRSLPQIGRKEIGFVDPAHRTACRSHLHLILRPPKDVKALPVLRRCYRLTNLCRRAPQRDLAIARVSDLSRARWAT